LRIHQNLLKDVIVETMEDDAGSVRASLTSPDPLPGIGSNGGSPNGGSR
jgi:hypothetical protein